MSSRYLLLLPITQLFIACKKEKTIDNPPQPPVLLKEIVIPNLPSPYYHFEYDAAGKVTFASYASDLTRYNILYDGERISEMKNNILVNKDRLQYFYDSQGKVEAINYADSSGIVYTRVDLFYDRDKLVKLERVRKSGTGFVYDKRITMSYYPDGNLLDITYHYLPFNGQTEAFYTSHFEQYDNKINVDGFDLIHNEFFDHFFLLPGVQLYKNNPGKETHTGDGVNYTVEYTYTYNDNNVPLNKKGNLVFTNGSNAGQRFETNSFYSYY
jgi:hypothetical protein